MSQEKVVVVVVGEGKGRACVLLYLVRHILCVYVCVCVCEEGTFALTGGRHESVAVLRPRHQHLLHPARHLKLRRQRSSRRHELLPSCKPVGTL